MLFSLPLIVGIGSFSSGNDVYELRRCSKCDVAVPTGLQPPPLLDHGGRNTFAGADGFRVRTFSFSISSDMLTDYLMRDDLI